MSQAVPTLRTRLRFALCILLVVGTSVSAALADVGVPPVRPARMVLQSRDVGSAYIQNKRFSRPRTLADAGNGDSQSIRRRLGQIWIGGYQTGFNGRRVPWGVVSTIDVFRTSRLADVERAWKLDLIRFTGGSVVSTPSAAPGGFRVLLRSRAKIGGQPAQIDLYMWQQGRAIATISVTGRPASFPPSLVVALARRQDAKIRAALR